MLFVHDIVFAVALNSCCKVPAPYTHINTELHVPHSVTNGVIDRQCGTDCHSTLTHDRESHCALRPDDVGGGVWG